MPRKNNSSVNITLKNPSSWGVKFVKTSQYYFQFRTDFFGNPQIATLSNDAKLLFLSILSECSRQSKVTVSYCLGYAYTLLSIPLATTKVLLRELESNDIIELGRGLRVANNNITEHNITEHNRGFENKPPERSTSDYDFEELYKTHYPRKGAGKTKGMETLSSTIKTDQDYQEFCTAIYNYGLDVRANDTPTKYIKLFSTFANNWRDYLEISPEAQSLKTAIEFKAKCDRFIAEGDNE